MPDLRVDYERLRQSERTMSSLVSEFTHVRARVAACDQALGSPDMASAMDAFAGNWDYHRRKLVSSMEALGRMVSTSLQSFRHTDSRLASDLTRRP